MYQYTVSSLPAIRSKLRTQFIKPRMSIPKDLSCSSVVAATTFESFEIGITCDSRATKPGSGKSTVYINIYIYIYLYPVIAG